MKARQFGQLTSIPSPRRDDLLIEGLSLIASTVHRYRTECAVCVEAGAHDAARLLHNAAIEEAGKFLLLIDHYRDPSAGQAEQHKHFRRAGNHLAKLIYAQIADYSIGDRDELLSAVNRHRAESYLDGPNEVDWIFPNELLAEREGALYTDLVDSEGTLLWQEPRRHEPSRRLGRAGNLVQAIVDVGLVSTSGFRALEGAWADFDPSAASRYIEWARRTEVALETLTVTRRGTATGDEWHRAAASVIELWPMPMTRVDLSMSERPLSELQTERDNRWEAFLASEFGYPAP